MLMKLLNCAVAGSILLSQMIPTSIVALEASSETETAVINEVEDNQTVERIKLTGELEIDLKFVLPIYNTLTTNMNIKLIDKEGAETVISLNDLKEPVALPYELGAQKLQVLARKLDKEGRYLSGNDPDSFIVYIGTTVYGLEKGTYQVEISGMGYQTYTTSVTIDDYAKRISLSNETGLLEAGDLNGDSVVDSKDIDLLIQSFGNYQAKYDLNRDQKVDIADLNYITATMNGTKQTAAVVDTRALVDPANVSVTGNITGTTDHLFVEDGSIQIAPSQEGDITESNPARFTLDMKKPIQASELRLETGYEHVPTNMLITVVTEDGETIEIPKTFTINEEVHTFTDKANSNTIVVRLGKQVAVKRVIITITETSSNKLADIAKVDFLNNVYEEVPIAVIEKPTHVNVTVGSEEATVKFDSMRNVTGYEILVEELNTSGSVVKSTVYQTTYNQFKVSDLKNYTTYRIRVQSVNQEWKSGYGEAVTAMPVPTRKPPKVNMVVVNPTYAGFQISWKKMDDTLSYNIYYRKKGTTEYTVIRNISATSYSLTDLEVMVEYEICISGNNDLGEGPKSDMAVGRTMDYTMPNVTNYNLINRPNDTNVTDHIKKVTLSIGNNTGGEFALVDNRYDTYWLADTWDTGGYNTGKKGPIIELDGFYKMGYVVLVPKESNASFSYVHVNYWNQEGKLQQASAYLQSLTSENGQKYYKVGFNQPITTNKIQISLANYTASGNIAIREMKFYEHDTLLDDVAALFKDDLRIELQDNVTLSLINSIRDKVNTIDPISKEYSPNRTVLLSDLEYAEKLLNDKNVQDVITVDTKVSSANDGHLGFAMSINDFQPLGISARAGETIAVYVGNNGSVEPELIFTQYYAEANVWSVTHRAKLKKGQNIIEVPRIGSGADERGGSVYIRYPGKASNDTIKVRVSGGTKIPVLDLHKETEETIKRDLIRAYVSNIQNYVSKLPSIYENDQLTYDKRKSVLNVTEIVTEEGLFSIPASAVVETLSNLNEDQKVERILESTKAFDEMVNLFYRHKGLSDTTTVATDKAPTSRINIRYMRMFDGAFMYAGGRHIGVEYGSTGGLLTGKTYGNASFNGYFGWGISHEIGHQINQGKLAYAEVTNNIYALLAQTANDTSLSRLESSNIYSRIYEKVTSGTQGKASNVFASLGMYWQLHLAYDNQATFTDTNSIFARINQFSRSSTLQGNKDDLLVMYASDAAGENLIPFFEKWGYVIGDTAKQYVNSKYLAKPSKAIWYLNDEARRYRINGGTAIANTTQLEATMTNADTQNKKVTLSFQVNAESDKILGYEIKRNGEVIMFTTSNTYTDVIGAINNRAVTYEVTAYDKLLNPTNTVVLEEIKIAHDGSIPKDNVTIESNVGEVIDYENPDQDMATLPIQQFIDGDLQTVFTGTVNDKNDAYVILHLNQKLALSGIKYTAGVEGDTLLPNTIQDYEIYVSKDHETWTLAKKGTFQVSPSNPTETLYFDKEGTTEGDQLWTYNDIAYVKIVSVGNKTGLSGAEIDLIAPPGDNVEMRTENIGILSENYCYQVDSTGKQECIEAGMVVFKGEYRGDPAFNVVLVANANDPYTRYSGSSLFFASLNNEGDVYEVADGTWFYAVTPEEYEKMVGTNVRAYLYRVDDALSLQGERLTSTSTSVKQLPAYDTLPSMVIESE